MRSAGVDFESHVYKGAGHAFACDARPVRTPRTADADWHRTHAFLDKHLPQAS